MIKRVVQSELIKLRRPALILPFALTGLVLAAAATYALWHLTPAVSPDGLSSDPGSSQMPVALPAFGESDGMGAAWRFIAPQFSLITFIVVAMVAGTEFRHSTWKNIFARSGSRASLLLGRLLAVTAAVAAGSAIWGFTSMVTALVAAHQLNVPTAEWFTSAGFQENGLILASATGSQMATAAFATALTFIARSSVVAIIGGLCWSGVIEPIIVASSGAQAASWTTWLPNQVIKQLSWQPAWDGVLTASILMTAAFAISYATFRTWSPKFS